jgi:2-dehydro-3-deoxygalactonokinase
METTILGIDWGTSNRRAYLIDHGGRCLAEHADGEGLLAVRGDFAGSLAKLRATMGIANTVPVIMSGMVGSASGWQEAPYLDVSVPLAQLPAHLVEVAGHPGCRIVPGYLARNHGVDVMRGEETQLLGALALGVRDGWIVLPGTHSKWVFLRDGCVEQLSTYMTGELFAMLGREGTLAALMAPSEPDAAHTADAGNDAGSEVAAAGEKLHEDDIAFSAGLAEARQQKPLTHSLFGVRARVVSHTMAASTARSFVSGLLIGTEFAAAEARGSKLDSNTIHLIASTALSARYASAARQFDLQAVVLDPDHVYLAALQQFIPKEAS